MTTNHPENLDEALVRTGRVDVKVGFDYASGGQVRELFQRMYGGTFEGEDGDEKGKKRQGQADGVKGMGRDRKWSDGLDLFDHTAEGWEDISSTAKGKGEMSAKEKRERLQDAAEVFAGRVPERVFSPSDIQGFLLLHKKTPLRALKEVEAWVGTELEKKREKETKA